ncbi:MAG: DUF3048 domain-containing protein, partial [Ilumatobacter sp.]|nr:DUF3048 domain-containing protein [Ilumatobacter sp.]
MDWTVTERRRRRWAATGPTQIVRHSSAARRTHCITEGALMNHKITSALVALAATAAASCSGGNDTTVSTAETTVQETTTSSTVVTEPPETSEPAEPTTTIVDEDAPIRQPLTGDVVESEDDLEARAALAVKIDNNDRNARQNHSGLAVADIVFEEIVEGDTRFAAVFHTEGSDPVGPI